jgi:hypothetical protein
MLGRLDLMTDIEANLGVLTVSFVISSAGNLM